MSANSKIKFTPLGGVAEIGSNMMLVESEKSCILIDSGILFPYESLFDIDYLIPDMSVLDKKKVTDIIYTHGHEDHIGAVPHIIEKFPKIKIHCSSLTRKFLLKRLWSDQSMPEISLFDDQSEIEFDDFVVHPIHVNHSIPQTFGLHFKISKKSIFYASDFKVVKDCVYEKDFDFKRLEELSKDCKQRTLFADSTNILKRQDSLSETDLVEPIKKIIKTAKHWSYITFFSSNIYRLKSILTISKELGKQVVLYGRSVQDNFDIARDEGIIGEDLAKVITPFAEVKKDHKNLVICLSGCQGDFRGALNRVSSGAHPVFKIRKDDQLIYSAKSIPGNESTVTRLFNRIVDSKGIVYTDFEGEIHASGHASREDLINLISRYGPNHYIPIHGSSYFLEKNIELSKSEFPKVKTHSMRNHHELCFDSDKGWKIKEKEILPPKLIYSKNTTIDRKTISQRRKIAQAGLVLINISISRGANLEIDPIGLPEEANELCELLSSEISEIFLVKTKRLSQNDLKEEIRIFARKFLSTHLGKKPIVRVSLF
ncbi:MAG: ribonuclease J [Bacteriovoracaceae bacterium]|jgi:ribonuclease J|nr:ribonuclease J [Bacteriovoracaceae bacterium]